MFRTLFLAVLTTLFVLAGPAWPQTKTTVRVTGEGVTPYEAQQDAIRKALQLSLDQFVVQETIFVDEELLLDQISSSTNGVVERFQIVTSSGSEGHFLLVADVVLSPAGIKNLLGSSATETVKVDISGVLAEAGSKSKKRAAEKKKQAEKAAIEAAKVETNTRAAMALMQERFSEPSTRMFETSTSFKLNVTDPNVFEATVKIKWASEFIKRLTKDFKAMGAREYICKVPNTDHWSYDTARRDRNAFDCELISLQLFGNDASHLRSNSRSDWFKVCFNTWDGSYQSSSDSSFNRCYVLTPVEWEALKPVSGSPHVLAAGNRPVVGRFGVELKLDGHSIGAVFGKQAVIATKERKNNDVANASREFAFYINCDWNSVFGERCYGEDLLKLSIPIEILDGAEFIETVPFIHYD